MGNTKSSNPFISYSSKPDYFQNYKFDHFCFELYDEVIPNVDTKYPTFTYDGEIFQNGELFLEVEIYTLILTKDTVTPLEIIWMVKSKTENQLFTPVWNDNDDNKFFIKWLNLIYSWTIPNDTKLQFMVPQDNSITDYYIKRKVYLEQEPDTPHLTIWAGKKHYMEWIGGPEPKPVCSCCANTRIAKPSDEEIINSTETDIDIRLNDFELKFDSKGFNINLINGEQNSFTLTYDFDKKNISLSWNNWVYPSSYSSFYAKFYKGKFLIIKNMYILKQKYIILNGLKIIQFGIQMVMVHRVVGICFQKYQLKIIQIQIQIK